MRHSPRQSFSVTAAAALLAASCCLTAAESRAVIDRYCLGCHTDRVKSGGLSLTPGTARTASENPEVWEKVVRKLQHRHMPPLGMPRPEEATYEDVVRSLTSTLDSLPPNPGRTATFRRLTRFEYRNAIRDLLGLDVDVSALLPPDESSHGFDNVTVSNLSPTLMERYLAASQTVSKLAAGTVSSSPSGYTVILPPDLTQEEHQDGLPYGTRGGAIVHWTAPLDATYDIQFRLSRDRNERVEGLDAPYQAEVAVDGKRTKLFRIEPPPKGQSHENVDRDFSVKVPLTAGAHDILITFLRRTSALIETERQPTLAHFNMDRHPRIQPALYSVSILGPYDAKGVAPASLTHRKLFVCAPKNAGEEEPCARRILSTVLRRGWRGYAKSGDTEAPLRLYREARKDGNFQSGIEVALRSILVSPHFLFRIEKNPSGPSGPVSSLELASRLSFFLWSSIPDDELLEVAAAGKLNNRDVLDKQVRRLLADSRSEALVTNFASQWLYLRNLASSSPDPRLFPDFDDNLRQSFRRETELFVDDIFRGDRSVLDLLRAKYTYVNELLAKHYGIENIYGSRFRRVELDPALHRGGLLTQGSVLTVTAYATRTSPVIRGKFILTNLLAMPPAPPPPEVPPLKEPTGGAKPLTLRERVAQHRANPACASCHNLMDPVGFALENYDAVGRWRASDSGSPVDASGALPDGTKFSGAEELQKALLHRPELFVSALTEKLMTYALGRGVEYYDAPSVRRIVRDAARQDYKFSSIVLGIVNSPSFLMRSST